MRHPNSKTDAKVYGVPNMVIRVNGNGQKPHAILLWPKSGLDMGSTVSPPHALLTVAAPMLKAGYTVRLLDQRVERITEETVRPLISSDLMAIGISTMSGTQIWFALGLAKMFRKLTDGKVPIVFGGCHPTVTPEQTLSHPLVDIVVDGEGDYTMLEILEALGAKRSLVHVPGILYKDGTEIVKTLPRELCNVEELLPVPWELVDVEKYIHRDMYIRTRYRVLDIGQTSRGCPFSCAFCSSASIRDRQWRAQSLERVMDDLQGAIRRFRLDGWWWRDDEFYIKRKRANAIFEAIVRAGIDGSWYTSGTRCDVFGKATEDEVALMRRAGAYTLKFGAESGSQRILDLMQKDITVAQTLEANQKCKRHGITPAFALMVGYPTETFEEINQTIDLGYRLKRENPHAELETMAQYTPLPGTPDWHLALAHGLQPPKSLEEWSNFVFDEFDLEGIKSPWYPRRERRYLGNISYSSILANALDNAVSSLNNPWVRIPAQLLVKPAAKYFKWRLSTHRYRTMPELEAVRLLREKLFYKSTFTFE